MDWVQCPECQEDNMLYENKIVHCVNESCNYKGLLKVMDKDLIIAAYQRAINEIDDYFEYQAEKGPSYNKVYDILNSLTRKLVELNK